jgi:transposase
LDKLLIAGALANGFPAEPWTLVRVAILIEREFGVKYRTVYIWQLLSEMNFSCQRPIGCAAGRDEQAIAK